MVKISSLFVRCEVFTLPSFLKDRFSGQGVLGWQFLAFRTLNISPHSVLAYEVSVEKSDYYKGGFPVSYKLCFSFLLRFSLSFCFEFFILCLGNELSKFILFVNLELHEFGYPNLFVDLKAFHSLNKLSDLFSLLLELQ